MPKQESLCRICGESLNFNGFNNKVNFDNDYDGLVCEGCIPIAKLEKIIKENKNRKDLNYDPSLLV